MGRLAGRVEPGLGGRLAGQEEPGLGVGELVWPPLGGGLDRPDEDVPFGGVGDAAFCT